MTNRQEYLQQPSILILSYAKTFPIIGRKEYIKKANHQTKHSEQSQFLLLTLISQRHITDQKTAGLPQWQEQIQRRKSSWLSAKQYNCSMPILLTPAQLIPDQLCKALQAFISLYGFVGFWLFWFLINWNSFWTFAVKEHNSNHNMHFRASSIGKPTKMTGSLRPTQIPGKISTLFTLKK